MLPSSPIFQKYFPGDSYKPVDIPLSVYAEAKKETLASMPMSGFKEGSFPECLNIEFSSPLRTLGTAPSDDAMFAFVLHKGKIILLFQSYLLTNFRNAEAVLNGIPIKCSEQTFKLGCADVHPSDANYVKVVRSILYAERPKFAKQATDGLACFNPDLWNLRSQGAMFRAVLGSTMNKGAFEIFQKCIVFSCTQAGDQGRDLGAFPPIRVMEATKDKNWGIGVPCMEALDLLKAQAALTPDADLFDMAGPIIKGKNQLGEIIVDVMRLIHGKTFEEHLAFVGDFEFFRVVE